MTTNTFIFLRLVGTTINSEGLFETVSRRMAECPVSITLSGPRNYLGRFVFGLVYGGDDAQQRSDIGVLRWRDISSLHAPG